MEKCLGFHGPPGFGRWDKSAARFRGFSYPDPLHVTETITGGILDGVSRTFTLDTYSRPGEISVTSGAATHSTNYSYDLASRLENVNSGTHNAGYGYIANSDAVEYIFHDSSLLTYRGLDAEDRLFYADNYYGAGLSLGEVQGFGVEEFDAMNRRKKIAREDGTRWNYGYNTKGEVTSGKRELVNAPNTAVPGWNYLYQFDQIGNRNTATVNGRFSIYTKNSLNQIISRSVPRGFDVLGKASTTASVTVDGQPATRLYEYFHRPMTTGTGAVHVPYSVAATDANGTTTRSGGKFLPASPEASTYDFDGNLTSDGRFTYVWDAENRLVSMETHATVPVPARRKLAFAYDGGSRRIRKTVWHGNAGGTWDFKHEHRFVHELGGWNIQAELKADGSFLRTYVWGTDLSGNFSGAGGVGGLLFTNILADKTTHAHGYDLNGNVTLLVNAATGEATATYDYGPFGEPIRESGEYAKLNPFRFSTKYTDDETGLLDYGYRYYDPVTGRWPSRDLIEEQGGINLYGFVGNSPPNFIDLAGLSPTGPGRGPAGAPPGASPMGKWYPILMEPGFFFDRDSLVGFTGWTKHATIAAQMHDAGGEVWAELAVSSWMRPFSEGSARTASVKVDVWCDDDGNASISPLLSSPDTSKSGRNAAVHLEAMASGDTATAKYAAVASYK